MSQRDAIPLILIIDDLFGRTHPDRRNEERANLCGQYLIEDITGDEVGKGTPQRIKNPVAQAIFCRGQTPTCSTVGDTVENDLEGALRLIRDGWIDPNKPRWSMVLLDLCFYTGRVTQESNRKTLGMPEGRHGDDPQRYFGLRLLEAIHDEYPDLPVIILSSKSRKEVSQEFSRKDALGFLPREDSRSPELLREYLWRHGLIPDDTGEIIGDSKPLLLALRAARRAASDRRNILIRGARGTGKELLAHYIHRHSKNQGSGPFVVVNSSVLTPELFPSELFGIESGTATQVKGREGLIRRADGGELFFDEIKDMLPQVQAGILRVIEQREIMPMGARKTQPVDVRFISATNIDIEAMAASGNFRSDLLDRLCEGKTIYLPPLRDHKEDIPLLVEKFVRDAESANPNAMRRDIDAEALEELCAYDWPGNIRELRSCIFSAVNDHPDVEHLVRIHVELPTRRPPQQSLVVTGRHVSAAINGRGRLDDIKELIQVLSSSEFESARSSDLAGKLPQIQTAYARVLARFLKAALKATSKPTPDNPSGEIRIHPAIKLITGDSRLTASKAADLIKRLLGICPEALDSILEDPMLKEAYETALRLRPRQRK